MAKGKVGVVIWQGTTDYGRVDWKKVKDKLKKNMTPEAKALKQFDSTWMNSKLFGDMQGLVVPWKQFRELCAQLVNQPFVITCSSRITM